MYLLNGAHGVVQRLVVDTVLHAAVVCKSDLVLVITVDTLLRWAPKPNPVLDMSM